MKLPTPSTSHIRPADFEALGIYEPAEDSFLIIDTISSSTEAEWLRDRFGGSRTTPLVLEVGTGSGVIIAFVTAHAEVLFGRRDVLTMAVDVNENAVREARKTVEGAVRERRKRTQCENGTEVNSSTKDDAAVGTGLFMDAALSDLTTAVRPGSADVLIFNPPYVPTEELPAIPNHSTWTSKSKFEKESHLLALSYAGGEDGMETTNRLLGQLDRVLSVRGVAYVLFCARNRPMEVVDRLRKGEWRAEVERESGGKGGWERLSVVRIWRELADNG